MMPEQLKHWREINALSESIAIKALGEDWHEVLDLAEVRDSMVDAFFRQGICRNLLPRVMADVSVMTKQHTDILLLIKEKQRDAQHREEILTNAKMQIEQISKGD